MSCSGALGQEADSGEKLVSHRESCQRSSVANAERRKENFLFQRVSQVPNVCKTRETEAMQKCS